MLFSPSRNLGFLCWRGPYRSFHQSSWILSTGPQQVHTQLRGQRLPLQVPMVLTAAKFFFLCTDPSSAFLKWPLSDLKSALRTTQNKPKWLSIHWSCPVQVLSLPEYTPHNLTFVITYWYYLKNTVPKWTSSLPLRSDQAQVQGHNYICWPAHPTAIRFETKLMFLISDITPLRSY